MKNAKENVGDKDDNNFIQLNPLIFWSCLAALLVIITFLIIVIIAFNFHRRRTARRNLSSPQVYHRPTFEKSLLAADSALQNDGFMPDDNSRRSRISDLPSISQESAAHVVQASEAVETTCVVQISPDDPYYITTDDGDRNKIHKTDFEVQELLKPDMAKSKIILLETGKLLVFISRKVGAKSETLVLDNMGISLYIPQCAIQTGNEQIIFLALVWDLLDFPNLNEKQTIIGPVVHVGPHNIKLKKPAVLSFRHCGFHLESVQVLTSETDLFQKKSWRPLEKQYRSKLSNTFNVLQSECQVILYHFSDHTCISASPNDKKWIQIIGFCSRIDSNAHCEMHLYTVNDTPCASQFVIEKEKQQNFIPIRQCPHSMLFDGSGGELVVEIENLSKGWAYSHCKYIKKQVHFLNIWHNKCTPTCFVFNRKGNDLHEICINMKVYQKGKKGGKPEKLEYLIKSSQDEEDQNRVEEEQPSSNASGSTEQEQPAREPALKIYCHKCRHKISKNSYSPTSIPHVLKMELTKMLDHSETGEDWRVIASALGLDSDILYYKGKDNPCEKILDKVEQMEMGLDWLLQVLLECKRYDAASIISTYLQTIPKTSFFSNVGQTCKDQPES